MTTQTNVIDSTLWAISKIENSNLDSQYPLSNIRSLVSKNIAYLLWEAFKKQIHEKMSSNFSMINSSDSIDQMVDHFISQVWINQKSIPKKYLENIDVENISHEAKKELLLSIFSDFSSIEDIYEYIVSLDTQSEVDDIQKEISAIDEQLQEIYWHETMSLKELNLYQKYKSFFHSDNNNTHLIEILDLVKDDEIFSEVIDQLKKYEFDFSKMTSRSEQLEIMKQLDESTVLEELTKEILIHHLPKCVKENSDFLELAQEFSKYISWLYDKITVTELIHQWDESLEKQNKIIGLSEEKAQLTIELEELSQNNSQQIDKQQWLNINHPSEAKVDKLNLALQQYNNSEISKTQLLWLFQEAFDGLSECYKSISIWKNILWTSVKPSRIHIILSWNKELFESYYGTENTQEAMWDKKSRLEKKIFQLFLWKNYEIDGLKNFDMNQLSQHVKQTETAI